MNETHFNKLYEGPENTERFEKYFRLQASLSVKNLVGFNQELKLVRMPNVNAILENFFSLRLAFYEKRKDYLVSKIVRDLSELKEKERFIVEVVEEKINIRNVRKLKICQILKERKYLKYSDLPKIKSTKQEQKQTSKKQVEDD
jgi:DNA topoisomerase-2